MAKMLKQKFGGGLKEDTWKRSEIGGGIERCNRRCNLLFNLEELLNTHHQLLHDKDVEMPKLGSDW